LGDFFTNSSDHPDLEDQLLFAIGLLPFVVSETDFEIEMKLKK
jgi:hypothetical protein